MNKSISFGEFVCIVALLMSLTALSIDAMLPALSIIGEDLNVTHPNDAQLIISMVFLGISIGMLFYGPFSDSFGRKPALYLGLAVFIMGCFISLFAESLFMMLLGRFLQGFGAASPRVVNIALVRDSFEGRTMAQVMSFSMTLFIFIPAIAPLLGQGILAFFSWHAIFVFFILFALLVLCWFGLRMKETLVVEKRRAFKLDIIIAGTKETLTNPIVFGYTIILSAILGVFIGFLSSVQQVLGELYHTGEDFPFYFAVLALSLGLASFINGKIVIRFGTRTLGRVGMLLMIALATIFLPLVYMYSGVPSLWMVMIYFMCTFFSVGMLFGNLNAISMEPLGHIAGIGSAIIGSVSTLLSLPIGIFIGQMYSGTILPLVWGFLITGLFSFFFMGRIEAKRSLHVK